MIRKFEDKIVFVVLVASAARVPQLITNVVKGMREKGWPKGLAQSKQPQ
jgi:hypothetical protein